MSEEEGCTKVGVEAAASIKAASCARRSGKAGEEEGRKEKEGVLLLPASMSNISNCLRLLRRRAAHTFLVAGSAPCRRRREA